MAELNLRHEEINAARISDSTMIWKSRLQQRTTSAMEQQNYATHFKEMEKINCTSIDQSNTRINPVATIRDCVSQTYTHKA